MKTDSKQWLDSTLESFGHKTKTVTIDGQEYELVDLGNHLNTDMQEYLALKPIAKPVEKSNYELTMWNPNSAKHLYTTEQYLTEPQATALSTAIQALVEYVQGDRPGINKRLDDAVSAAFEAMASQDNE